ncbi:MAG: glutathione S-transferase N-terminal domain-containing protein [Pararhodobacter sp.]|nr:glutathione S-transferase N-terminal domain-containing protein [Pararhodobacter sp.]
MDYHLCIGDRAYSSWSLRGWLLLEGFGLHASIKVAPLYSDEFARTLTGFAPARTVPALRLPDGLVVADSLAIAEELASRHPHAGHLPTDARARAVARALVAEMHASFTALRSHCPMNLRVSYSDCAPPQAVLDDLARLDMLWDWARSETGSTGLWLCGDYSVADAFFAPVAARVAGYNLPMPQSALAYVSAQLTHGPFRRWRAMALVDGPDQPFYRRDWPTRPWPGPTPLPAQVCEGPSVNAGCPYSGKPVTHFLRVQEQTLGFCNAFCRDKTLSDVAAWPQAMSLLKT